MERRQRCEEVLTSDAWRQKVPEKSGVGDCTLGRTTQLLGHSLVTFRHQLTRGGELHGRPIVSRLPSASNGNATD
jgi:hypothetical protein